MKKLPINKFRKIIIYLGKEINQLLSKESKNKVDSFLYKIKRSLIKIIKTLVQILLKTVKNR
jgi:hypothetical protein